MSSTCVWLHLLHSCINPTSTNTLHHPGTLPPPVHSSHLACSSIRPRVSWLPGSDANTSTERCLVVILRRKMQFSTEMRACSHPTRSDLHFLFLQPNHTNSSTCYCHLERKKLYFSKLHQWFVLSPRRPGLKHDVWSSQVTTETL